MKLVVGLGNPGSNYKKTRHNIGFDVLAELANRHPGSSPTIKSNGEIVESRFADDKILLVAPQTYMNLSGSCVQPLMKFYKLEPENLLVVCDDMNLEVGKLRLRAGGSAGGQNGLADILQKLGTNEIHRLRIGIGRPPERVSASAYVLGKFFPEQIQDIEKIVSVAADAVECWASNGMTAAMNQFNSFRMEDEPEK